MTINRRAMADDLTDAFIGYQSRLDFPMQSPTEAEALGRERYRSDPVFHAKVNSLVSGVLHVIYPHLEGCEAS